MGTTFESISRGLNEAIAHAKGKKISVKTYTPEAVDVSALRQHMGMTQEQFGIGSAGIVRRMVHRWCC
jgi:putative transcriptional regulator